jgi:hypothetical protein
VTTFDYRTTKDGTVFITWQGRDVTTLRGSVAQRFLARAEGAQDDVVQDLLRRATGNFKHGNERVGN